MCANFFKCVLIFFKCAAYLKIISIVSDPLHGIGYILLMMIPEPNVVALPVSETPQNKQTLTRYHDIISVIFLSKCFYLKGVLWLPFP